MKSSGIGGQAVIEGVMMKNGDRYAVSVRKPDGGIETMTETYHSVASRCRLFQIPFIRGTFNFIDSMILGMRTLNYSASFYDEGEDDDADVSEDEAVRKKKREDAYMAVTMIFSVILAVAIFMLLPTWLAGLIRQYVLPGMSDSYFVLAAVEGVIRIAIFIGYVWAISLMPDVRRVYMYHGAEHKSINCIEHGYPLTVENVRASSKEHKRCGTSFLLLVVVVSVFVFMFVRTETLLSRFLMRIVLLPVIAGISYEFLRLAGSSENPVVNALSRPGLLLQKLTTREPDDEMIEVAIASVDAVYDWRAYLRENYPDALRE